MPGIRTTVNEPPSFIYLASQSPRRRAAAGAAGRARTSCCCPMPTRTREALEAVLPGRGAGAPTCSASPASSSTPRVARLRAPRPAAGAGAVLRHHRGAGPHDLGKPRRRGAMRARMLRELSGATHRVLTAVAVQHGSKRHAALSDSRVTLRRAHAARRSRPTSTAASRWARPAPMRCRAGRRPIIAHISGSYSGIMGLPMYETAQLLRASASGFENTACSRTS